MSEARLGCRTFYPIEYRDEPGFMERIKEQVRYKLGGELIANIASRTNPTVARLIEKDIPAPGYFHNHQGSYEIIVDLAEVEMMRVRMAELPEFEFVSRSVINAPVVEWQCGYCGQVNMVTEHLECRKCGAPRKALI